MDTKNESCQQIITVKDLIFGFIREHSYLFILYIIVILILPLQEIGLPHYIGELIKKVQTKQDISSSLIVIIVIMFVIQVGYTITDYINIHIFPEMQKYVRETVMNHLFATQDSHYEELKLGEITTKLIKLPLAVYAVFNEWKKKIVPSAVVFLFAIVYFLCFDYVIAVSSILLVIALCLTIYYSVTTCTSISMMQDKTFNDIYEEVDDVMRNVVTVLNYKQTDKEMDRIDNLHDIYSDMSKKSLQCALNVRFIFIPIILVYMIFFVIYSYKNVMKNKAQLGKFVAIFMILIHMITMMWKLIDNVKDMIYNWGIINESMNVFLQCNPERKPFTEKVDAPKEGIYLYDVAYHYKEENRDKTIFEHLNIHIHPKESVLIVGKIGSGKTTILKLIMKYLEPNSGEIFLDGVPYTDISSDTIKTRIGYIPQTPILFNRTIYENIVYGLKNTYTREDIYKLLETFQIQDMIEKNPEGLDYDVGKYGSKLSGGQRQMIWILRTMLQKPDIVVMDEPTSAIDENTKDIVQKMLAHLMKDKTVVMVTHDKYLKKYCDRIIELDHGKIVSDTKMERESE